MNQEGIKMREKTEAVESCSRRNIIKGAATLLVGSIAGGVGYAYAGTAQKATQPAPPLPWEWPKLDPLEAGTRAYQAYLKNKG